MARSKSKIGPGRPRVSSPKNERLTARITPADLDRIKRAAARAEKTPSLWASEALTEKLIRETA